MENKYVNNVKKRIGRTIMKHGLIQENDKILVALSGGKDSLILLESLVDRQRCLPFKFEMAAIHIYIKNIGYKTDIEYLRKFCADANVEFILKEFEVDMDRDPKKGICFICSWNRRKAIFDVSKELGFNKLAFGHHMDDALETLLMNMIYHGSISSMPYSFKMFEGRVELIRPLLEMSNEELLVYAGLREFKKELKNCPFENSNRKEVSEIINKISGLNNAARKNLFRSMTNSYPEYLPQYKR